MIYIHVSKSCWWFYHRQLPLSIMEVRRQQSVETSDWFGHSGSLEAGPRAIILPGISCHYQNQPATVLGTYLFYLKLQRPRYWRLAATDAASVPSRVDLQVAAAAISDKCRPPRPLQCAQHTYGAASTYIYIIYIYIYITHHLQHMVIQ